MTGQCKGKEKEMRDLYQVLCKNYFLSCVKIIVMTVKYMTTEERDKKKSTLFLMDRRINKV